MRLILCAIVAGVFLGGCATNLPPVPQDVLSALTGGEKRITIHYYESPKLNIMSVKSVAGNGLAATLSKSDNLSSASQNNPIGEPSEMLAKKFLQDLKANGVRKISLHAEAHSLPFPKETPNYGDDSDYSLVVRILGLEANYLPLHWQTYAFSVQGEGKLIRNTDDQVVWQGRCFQSGYRDNRMKLDVTEFDKNDGAKVKELLELGTNECSKKMASNFFQE